MQNIKEFNNSKLLIQSISIEVDGEPYTYYKVVKSLF